MNEKFTDDDCWNQEGKMHIHKFGNMEECRLVNPEEAERILVLELVERGVEDDRREVCDARAQEDLS
jgi:hypothetical protein